MFNRLRSVVSGAVEGMENPKVPMIRSNPNLPHKHKYARPVFLNLSEEGIAVSKDKKSRPILSSSPSMPLPYNGGYAECVNAGKSNLNEDMAQAQSVLIKSKRPDGAEEMVPYTYFAIFDGHAGYGAALDASKQLHHIIHQKLVDSIDTILSLEKEEIKSTTVSTKSLIIGCLESAFLEMDEVVRESRENYYNPGGCTAIVAMFIFGQLYVANAGDCRAVICDNGRLVEMSTDFSPSRDKMRIYLKAIENPTLMGDRYTVREFLETPTRDDLGKNVLYKDPYMTGWAYRTLSTEDLKPPLINGVGRRSRIMGTIGVARGLGDFDLTANHHKIPIKPFLSCLPEVRIFDAVNLQSKESVFIMGSDGLWDAVEPDYVMSMCSDQVQGRIDSHTFTVVAMNLVAEARGRKDVGSSTWVGKSANNASLDDISVFVIPLQQFIEDNAERASDNQEQNEPQICTTPVEVSDTESGSTPPCSPTIFNVPECDELSALDSKSP